MKEVTIYTDGACSGNPGPGGWAAILRCGDAEKELSGGEENTTNNRMELTAVIRGLQALKEPCSVTVMSDSTYVVSAIEKGWLANWQKKNWRTASGPVKNPELWRELLGEMARHRVRFVWVKGHAEYEFNNRCDRLAVAEWKKLK